MMGLFITKDQARSKTWYVNRYLQLSVGVLKKQKRKMERFDRFPYVMLAMFSSYFVSVSRYRKTQGSQSAT